MFFIHSQKESVAVLDYRRVGESFSQQIIPLDPDVSALLCTQE